MASRFSVGTDVEKSQPSGRILLMIRLMLQWNVRQSGFRKSFSVRHLQTMRLLVPRLGPPVAFSFDTAWPWGNFNFSSSVSRRAALLEILSMRLAIPLLATLFLVGWIACTFPGSLDRKTESAEGNLIWRRTTDGWEAIQWWRTEIHHEPPVPHPAVVGLLQVLIATTIGVASLQGTSVAERSAVQTASAGFACCQANHQAAPANR
jgi:hypothetical protein